MVEQKPSKLMTRVRFPSPAPDWNLSGFAEVNIFDQVVIVLAHVAQWQSTPLVRERSPVQSWPWAPYVFGPQARILKAH